VLYSELWPKYALRVASLISLIIVSLLREITDTQWAVFALKVEISV